MPRSQDPEGFGLRPRPDQMAVAQVRSDVAAAVLNRRNDLGLSLHEVERLSRGWVSDTGLWRLENGTGNTSILPLAVALDVLGLRIELISGPTARREGDPYDQGAPAFMLWGLYRWLACSILVDRVGVFDRTVYRQAGMDGHAFKRLLKGLYIHPTSAARSTENTPTLFALARLAGVLGLSVNVVDRSTALLGEPEGWPDFLPPIWFR